MYFVDREKIEEILVFLERQFSLFEEIKDLHTDLEKAAMERIGHTIVEGILDVGNAMIDGFIMRDPGSYEDIVDILDDEKVVQGELTKSMKEIVSYRKVLVQQYTNINHNQMKKVFGENLPSLRQFPEKVREYLLNELGPVSAFRH